MNELKHVAIIADGNNRYAVKNGIPRERGHEAGLHKIEDLMHYCVEFGIKYLSVYCFSLENWNRPKEEVDALFTMANRYFERYREFAENNIRVLISGCRDKLNEETLAKIERIQNATSGCTGLYLNLCCNYSGRREIADAVANGARTVEEISRAMYHDIPEPDLIIRTGGYRRLSNFLLWQGAYAELEFTDTLFPDYSKEEFARHIAKFRDTKRNYGGR